MRRWLVALSAVAGLGLASSGAGAHEVTPEQAPAAWVDYALASVQTITAWLAAEGPPAPRVRAVLNAARPAPDQPTAPLVVKLWVDGKGTVTRAEFPSFGDATADADLRALLVGRTLGAPPKHMRLPMRLALQLPPPRPQP